MNNIKIHEVGMRDGLQMETELLHLVMKEMLLKWLIESGVDIIQVGSFVNPKVLMQMQDTDELFEIFMQPGNKPTNTILSALVLNHRGFERGMKAGVEMFCMGISASETHSKKNTGKSVDEALNEIIPLALDAVREGKKVQVSVQSAFGCGFEGAISEDKVFSIVEKYFDAGLKNISLADTAGMATPHAVERMYSKLFDMEPELHAACHFHDTNGFGMENIETAIQVGVTSIETAFGGLGGCPFTKSATGNVATEDFVHSLQERGYRMDIKIDKLAKASNHMANFLVRDLPGKIYKSYNIKK